MNNFKKQIKENASWIAELIDTMGTDEWTKDHAATLSQLIDSQAFLIEKKRNENRT